MIAWTPLRAIETLFKGNLYSRDKLMLKCWKCNLIFSKFVGKHGIYHVKQNRIVSSPNFAFKVFQHFHFGFRDIAWLPNYFAQKNFYFPTNMAATMWCHKNPKWWCTGNLQCNMPYCGHPTNFFLQVSHKIKKRHVFNNSLLRHLPVGLCKEAWPLIKFTYPDWLNCKKVFWVAMVRRVAL